MSGTYGIGVEALTELALTVLRRTPSTAGSMRPGPGDMYLTGPQSSDVAASG